MALTLTAASAAAAYLVVCLIRPYTACRRCTGAGKRRTPTRRSWRPCRRCNGTGQRRRAGTALLAVLRTARGPR